MKFLLLLLAFTELSFAQDNDSLNERPEYDLYDRNRDETDFKYYDRYSYPEECPECEGAR